MSALLLIKARLENSACAQEQNGLPTASDRRPWSEDPWVRRTDIYLVNYPAIKSMQEKKYWGQDLQIINPFLT